MSHRRSAGWLALLFALSAGSPVVDAGELTLSWTDNSGNEEGFRIERSVEGASFAPIATVAADVTSYVDMGLSSGTTYLYRVQAYNSAGGSDYSNVASATPAASLLTNGGFGSFANGLAVGWDTQSAGGVVMTLSEDSGQTGQAQKIAITTTSSWGMFFYQQPNLAVGKTYTWTFWYKTDGPASAPALTASVTNGPHTAVVFDLALPGTSGTWQRVEKMFTFNNAEADMLRIGAVAVGSYWVDGMSLVEAVPLASANTAPTISTLLDLSIDAEGVSVPQTFVISDAETAAGSLTLTGDSSNPALVPAANIGFGGSGENRTVTITPVAGQEGVATITVTVSDGGLSATTSFNVTVSGTADGSRLINLSSRGMVSDGDPMIAGFSVGGEGQQTLLIRAVGKSLEKFGITDGLGDPVISIVPSKTGSTTIKTDGGWSDSPNLDALTAAMTEAGAFTLEKGSKDAAILLRLNPGLYTAVVQDSSRKGGTCLVEVYALDDDLQIVSGRLLNLSSRGYVGNGKDVLIAGLVIRGQERQRVLIRGIGPTLSKFGVSSPVSDPEIKVFAAGGNEAIASNDDWSSDGGQAVVIAEVSAAVGAFSLPQGSADAVMVLDLDPGIYTVHLAPSRGPGGTGLVEVYVVP